MHSRKQTSLHHNLKHVPRSKRWLFMLATVIILVGVIGMLQHINQRFLVTIPAHGGIIREGIIGTPRFINPVVASSNVDKEFTTLIYSGLLRQQLDGGLDLDLAQNYTVSDDGLTYTFTLRNNLVFHDGTPITSNDVLFTIEQIQNPIIDSPERVRWDGIVASTPDDATIVFTLQQPYAGFLHNTTIGILPKHLWEDIPTDQFSLNDRNLDPIGSGPYRIQRIKRNKANIPVEFRLRAFRDFSLGRPYINSYRIATFTNEDQLIDAFGTGRINAMSAVTPSEVLTDYSEHVIETPLPRTFALFFNAETNAIFADKAVRQALNEVIDREQLINDVLYGYATAATGPLPSLLLPSPAENETLDDEETSDNQYQRARTILDNAGWKRNENTGLREKVSGGQTQELTFSIATSDTLALKKTAEFLQVEFAKLGAAVTLQVFEIANLDKDVIRPREYEALLFGQAINHDSDLYAFWHSSQKNDPGLNIAQYDNPEADTLLSDALSIIDADERYVKYNEFTEIISKDVPAVFLYAPNFTYITDSSLKGVSLNWMSHPRDRFLHIHQWHTYTDQVWKSFAS